MIRRLTRFDVRRDSTSTEIRRPAGFDIRLGSFQGILVRSSRLFLRFDRYQAVDLILRGKRPSATGVKISRKMLKRSKSREHHSDFSDFWSELIALTWVIISKIRSFLKIPENFEKSRRNPKIFHLGNDQKQLNLQRHVENFSRTSTADGDPAADGRGPWTQTDGQTMPGLRT